MPITTSHGRILLPVLCIVAMLIAATMVVWLIPKPVTPRVPEMRTVLEILRSEAVQLLVTDRLAEQVSMAVDDSTLLLGRREGFLTATVRVYYGIDVGRITPADVNTMSYPVTVRLPEPEIISMAVDLESIRFITKTSALNLIGDYLRNRNLREELIRQLQRRAICQLQSRGVLPDRAALVARLNEQSNRLFTGAPVSIRFQ